jgi:hypothetical protein
MRLKNRGMIGCVGFLGGIQIGQSVWSLRSCAQQKIAKKLDKDAAAGKVFMQGRVFAFF